MRIIASSSHIPKVPIELVALPCLMKLTMGAFAYRLVVQHLPNWELTWFRRSAGDGAWKFAIVSAVGH